MEYPRPVLVHPRGITPIPSAAVLRRRAGYRRGGVIIAIALAYWRGACDTFHVGATEIVPQARRLVQSSNNDAGGGDDGVAMIEKGAPFGGGHQPNVSVLPVEWTDGEVDRCHPTSKVYPWRRWGWGSNINRLVFTWAGEVYEGRTGVALDLTGSSPHGLGLDGVECHPGGPEAEQRLVGWNCLFKPMRHLCIFDDEQELEQFMGAKPNLELQPKESRPQPRPADVSHEVAVPAALVNFIYSHLQPWFEADIRAIIEEDKLLSVRNGKYVAIHVRRGDKLIKEAKKVEVEEYLKAAASAIGGATQSQSGIEPITGLWVSSDDATVLPEARKLAVSFLPNVRRKRVVSISFRSVEDKNQTVPTTTTDMTYDRYVVLHTELAMMATADVFVGTFSSNIGRLVYLIREGLGFPRNSTISVDNPNWHLGRRSRA
ncbi:unnamed protein product [Scytosiphon promiscuus]